MRQLSGSWRQVGKVQLPGYGIIVIHTGGLEKTLKLLMEVMESI